MTPEIKAALEFSLMAFSSVFFIVDPFATIPAFIVMTAEDTKEKRSRTAKQAAGTCFLILTLFAAAGTVIFGLFGVTLPAFKIAGGLLLFLVAVDMLQAKRSSTQEVSEERAEGVEKDEVGVAPIGLPMLAGPGAISTVMVLMGQSRHWWNAAAVFAAITITSLTSYFILVGADKVRGFLGEIGIRVLMRLMGLVLVAIAVQFVINGIGDLGFVTQR